MRYLRGCGQRLLVGLSLVSGVDGWGCSTHVEEGPADDHGADVIVGQPGARGRVAGSATPAPALDAPMLVAFAADGALALVDPSTGHEMHRTTPLPIARGSDVAFDATGEALFVLSVSREEEGGEIIRFPLEAPPFYVGAGSHVGWIDGVARFDLLEQGLLTFEENIGARWKLTPRDGTPTVSVSCPRPSSIVVRPSGGGAYLTALSAPDVAGSMTSLVKLRVSSTGLGPCELFPLEDAPASPRLVEIRDGRDVVLGVDAGRIVAAQVRGTRLGGPRPTDIEAETVESVLSLEAASHAALVLSAGPPRLSIVGFGDETSIDPHAGSMIELGASIEHEERFFSREMIVVGRRVFVATADGVLAFDLVDEGSGTMLSPVELDRPLDAYRGPLSSFAPPSSRD